MLTISNQIKTKMPAYMTGCIMQQYYGAEDGARHTAENGYTHWYIDGSNYDDIPSKWDNARTENMCNLMQELDVQAVYHGNFKNPLASDVPDIRKAALSYLKSEIDLCEKFTAPLIIHGGAIVEPRSVKEAMSIALDGFVEVMQEASAYATDKGVELWLENLSNYQAFHPFYYTFTNIDQYRYVLPQIPNAKMIFDVCHETVGGGDPLAVFEELSDSIAAFSFSDTDGKRDSHWPMGEGNVDFDGLTRLIIENEWKGVVAFETRGAKPNENIDYVSALYEKHRNPQALAS
ncbi:sugar phosphate isomerase/epimerase family protein [Teredinibacter turnerae]|uniref:sugar phosphate isomerase/epimerase family protein n=1 Tax=Teredinibacter turnerae TaxID=2426 RepID=UPI0004098594|nr:sugar phosphate isomerase/epimerase family protein [Teredinibacter turnerae]